MSGPPIYQVWQDRIYADHFPKAICNQWSKSVFALANGYPATGAKSNLTADEAEDLLTLMRGRSALRGGCRLTPEHEAQGKVWLLKHGVDLLKLPDRVVTGFDHFTFNGEAVNVAASDYRANWRPVWRIHLTSGEQIDYFVGAWQDTYGGGDRDRQWWQVLQPT